MKTQNFHKYQKVSISFYFRLASIGMLMLLFPVLVYSQSTLHEHLKTAAENNPELKAKYNNYLAALEKVPQAEALPDPEVSFGYFISPVETRVGAQQAKISLKQMFPWFGRLDAAGKAASAGAETKFKSFEHARQKLFFEVRKQWYQLLKLEEDLSLHEENLRLLRSLRSLAERQYEAGNTGMADVVRAQLKINDAQSKLASLEEKRQPKYTDFNLLLNRDPQSSIQLPDSMSLQQMPETSMMDSILENNTRLQQIRAEKEMARQQKEVARMKGYPDFGVGLDYVNIRRRPDMEMPANGRDVLMPMVSISIPLYRKKYNAMEQEASIKIRSVSNREEELRNDLITEYEQVVWDYNDAGRRVELNQQQVREATDALDIIETGYISGEEKFQDLLILQQQILNYQLALVAAKKDQNIAVAKMKLLMRETNLDFNQE